MTLAYDLDKGLRARAALGLLVLQSDETIEHEFHAMLGGLPGVALHAARLKSPDEVTPETLALMEAQIPKAAALLPRAVDYGCIGYGCTSGATIIGPSNVARAITAGAKTRETTEPLSAVIAALRAVGARRIGFVTPYIAEVSAAMRGALEAAGFEISAFGSYAQIEDAVVAKIAPASTLRAIEAVNAQGPCDAVFVSCTQLRTLGILAQAEARIGKPVIASNQALAWRMARLAGLDDRIEEAGRLWEA